LTGGGGNFFPRRKVGGEKKTERISCTRETNALESEGKGRIEDPSQKKRGKMTPFVEKKRETFHPAGGEESLVFRGKRRTDPKKRRFFPRRKRDPDFVKTGV